MKTFQLVNLGCRASQADGLALARQLTAGGWTEAGRFEESAVAVLNTCTVTAAADAEVRQIVRRIHRQNPRCRILITGCYAQRAPQELAALDGVEWVVGNSHKHLVSAILLGEAAEPADAPVRLQGGVGPGAASYGYEALETVSRAEALDTARASVKVGPISTEFHFSPSGSGDRTRPTLKVQDGCDARCAFCVIPEVRGPGRSLAPDAVIAEIRSLDEQGYREVVLSGINLGSYGRDLDRRITFLGLLERILAETAVARIRISSIEPMDVSPALIRLVASERRMADHFHIPLQSGSDRILRLMNRRYWTPQYADRVLAIREALPHAGIGADVMTGFPGETEADHRASAEFIERLPMTYLHVFPYSARPNTAAATRDEQVPGRVSHERLRELRSLIAGKRQAFLDAQVGRTVSALTLGDERRGYRAALTSNYLPLSLGASAYKPNTMLDVTVCRVSEGTLFGYPVRAAVA